MRSLTIFIFFMIQNLAFGQTILKNINKGDGNTFVKNAINAGKRFYNFENQNGSELCHIYDTSTELTTTIILPSYSNEKCVFKLNNEIYFVGFEHYLNSKLYKIDSVNYSVDVVKDFNPQTFHHEVSNILVGENTAFIIFSNPKEILVTKGTTATTKVATNYYSNSILATKVAENKLFFLLEYGPSANLRVLFEDTYWDHNIGDFSRYSFNNIEAIGNEIVFSGSPSYSNIEFWKTTGNTAAMVQDLNPGDNSSYPYNFRKFGNKIVFNANAGNLYIYDGTTITYLGGINLYGEVAEKDGVLYFVGNQSSTGFELWKTNGTQAGTQLVQDLNPGSASGIENITYPVTTLKNINGNIIFRATNGLTGKELYKYDMSSISLVKDFNVGTGNSFIGEFSKIGNKVAFLAAVSDDQEREVYISDGTTAGTVPISSFTSSFPIYNTYLVCAGNNHLIFQAFTDSLGYELYAYSALTNTIRLIKNINTKPRTVEFNTQFGSNSFLFKNKALFFANDSKHGNELWVTDGEENNTYLLKDFTNQNYYYSKIFPEKLGDYRTNTFVNAIYSNEKYALMVINDNEIWKIDSNLVLTNLLKSNSFSASNYNKSSKIIKVGEEFFFLLNNGRWHKTDGTVAGTYMLNSIFEVKEILGLVNNQLVFNTSTENGTEPYKLDVTTGAISLLKDIYPGYFSSNSNFDSRPYTLGNKLIFLADDGVHNVEYWVTDGTEAGTQLLYDISNYYFGLSTSKFFGIINNAVIFTAITASGNTLWRTDGTPSGTYMVKDFNPSSASESFNYLSYNFDSTHVLFMANDNVIGEEPYITDGTASGTKLIIDYLSGSNSSYLSNNNNAVKVGDFVYFVLNNGKLISYNTQTSQTFPANQTGEAISIFKYENQAFVLFSVLAAYPNKEFKLYRLNQSSLIPINTEPFLFQTLFSPVSQPYFQLNGTQVFSLEFNYDKEYYKLKLCKNELVVSETNKLINTAYNFVNSSIPISTTGKVIFSSEKTITLSPGFSTNNQGVFKAEIKGCQQ